MHYFYVHHFTHLLLLHLAFTSRASKKIEDLEIKLIDGPIQSIGTVLIRRDGRLGYICDDHWTLREANVVCRQLHFDHAIVAFRRNKFLSTNKLPYLLDDVKCVGNEKRLTDCKHLPWHVHNCKRNEHVAVKCAPKKKKFIKKTFYIAKRSQVEFKIDKALLHVDGMSGVIPVVILMKDAPPGPICSDGFSTPSASLICQHLERGIAGVSVEIPMDVKTFPAQRHLLRLGKCYGNETDINQCVSKISTKGVECTNDFAVGVKCFDKVPDIKPDISAIENTSYLQKVRLWHLSCAIEEGCLPSSVNEIMKRNPFGFKWKTRSLIRFSSIIENVGAAPFIPLEPKDRWEWHACHMHYHSMKIFAIYNVVSRDGKVIASGHKASFCLEDSDCDRGITRNFRCSNVQEHLGTQGISPGCKDTYLHDYDCQWVDVTDVPLGLYELQVAYNPDMLVPESNFFNNGVRCFLLIKEKSVFVRHCKFSHVLELNK